MTKGDYAIFVVTKLTKIKMHNLQIQDITTLFVVVDDCLMAKPKCPGRPSALADSETLTILLWCALLLRQRNIIDIYRFACRYHHREFPALPNYANFVAHCHRLIPVMARMLQDSLATEAPLRFADSTMVEVCRLIRADSHRVAKGLAAFGKNHQGWHYGFKLHASVAPDGRFCGLRLTPANVHDAQMLPFLVEGETKIVVGDTHYGASVMGRRMWEEKGVFVVAPPHPKQRKKLLACWQLLLLRARPKIESAFDYLKNHLGLVTSFPRSAAGYLFHYLRILLAYQLMVTLG
jgi:hypothetical protein